MKVIDNLLTNKELLNLNKVLLGKDFPWYFAEGKSFNDDGDFQHCHRFAEFGKITSNFYKINFPILNKLNVDKIIRIKANATFKKDKNEQTPMHVDHIFKNNEKFKTGVFYCNTNNGSTLFQNGKRIYSKENRMVIFDGHQKHCGVHCTDQNRRVVINFNWTEKK